jgi:A/G-specific adenine glycosylase
MSIQSLHAVTTPSREDTTLKPDCPVAPVAPRTIRYWGRSGTWVTLFSFIVQWIAEKIPGAERYAVLQKKIRLKIQSLLLAWFAENQRALPWRKEYRPYEIWISEIMLQQTQVKTMLPYFHRWMARFPDVRSVARAREEELLKHWEGLGYYSRVKNIRKTAEIIVRDHGGVFPKEHRTILSLPGIGPYTAGAISSIAFNEDRPLVDGNVERILARLFNLDKPVKERASREFIWSKANELIPAGRARQFNQALMDLGATICLPRRAACEKCPLFGHCESRRMGTVEQRPVNGRRKDIVAIEVAVGILEHRGRVLIQKRLPSGLMPNLWEFPGGKIRPGESPEQALVREFREELELVIRCGEQVASIKHNYTSFKVSLHAFTCRPAHPGQKPVLHSAVEARWVPMDELDQYAFPAANRKLIGMISARKRAPARTCLSGPPDEDGKEGANDTEPNAHHII